MFTFKVLPNLAHTYLTPSFASSRNQWLVVEGGVGPSPASMAPVLSWLDPSTSYPDVLAALGQQGAEIKQRFFFLIWERE